jgi:hypothetical protein
MIIDADASGAAREFKKMGTTADRELGKTTKSLDKLSSKLTSVGTGALLAGGALAVGLTKFAKEASDAEAQQMKLNNSIKNSESVFAGNGKALRDQAAALMKVTVADDDAVASSQSLLVQFGRTEAEVLALTPLVVDLSRKMGIDLDAAAKAVGKASDGSTGALKKMGIEVVDLGGNASDTDNVISALSASVGSFAETEGASYAGQLEIMNNKFGELKESVGSGILDVVNPLLSIGGALGEVNPQIGETVGKVGAIGAAGSLAVGGLSILAGQAIKLRSVFTSVDMSSGVATRSLTGMGKAAAGLGFVAATAVVSDFVFGLLNAGDAADRVRTGIDKLTISINDTGDTSLPEFAELVAAEKNIFRFGNLISDFGAEISIVGTGVVNDIEQVQRVFDTVGKNQGPKAQIKILNELEKANQTLPKSSNEYKRNQEFIDKNRKALELSAKATESAAGATGELTTALGETSEEMTALGESASAYGAQLSFIAATQQLGADRAAAYSKAIEDSSALDEQAAAAFGMNSAYKDLFNTLNDLPKEFDVVSSALGDYTDEQNKAVEAVIGFGDKASSVLEEAIKSGGDPRFLGGIFRSRLEEVLKNAGIPPEQIAEYIGLAGLGEQQIDVAIKVSLAAEEQQKFLNILALFQATSQEFAPEILPKINELFLAGKFAELNALIVASQPGVEKTALEFILGVYPDLAPVLAATQAQADAAPVAVPFVPKTQEFNDAIDYLRFTAQVAANANPIQIPVVSVFSEGGVFAPGGLLNPGAPAGGLKPFAPSGPPTTTGGFFGSGQYSGGPVSKGSRYEVNEGGREFFTPSSNGFIMNAANAQSLVQGVSQLVSSGGGGRGMTNNITINETSSPRQTALEVIRANKASLFLAGAL